MKFARSLRHALLCCVLALPMLLSAGLSQAEVFIYAHDPDSHFMQTPRSETAVVGDVIEVMVTMNGFLNIGGDGGLAGLPSLQSYDLGLNWDSDVLQFQGVSYTNALGSVFDSAATLDAAGGAVRFVASNNVDTGIQADPIFFLTASFLVQAVGDTVITPVFNSLSYAGGGSLSNSVSIESEGYGVAVAAVPAPGALFGALVLGLVSFGRRLVGNN